MTRARGRSDRERRDAELGRAFRDMTLQDIDLVRVLANGVRSLDPDRCAVCGVLQADPGLFCVEGSAYAVVARFLCRPCAEAERAADGFEEVAAATVH